ncbi:precorrin-8X methylmutase [Halovulum sp. GXIMD14793]
MTREGRLFDRVIMVDWSARSKPSGVSPQTDAIWWAEATATSVAPPTYCRTRAAAMAQLAGRIAKALDSGERLLIGFDFPFGYPAGVAKTICGAADARALWRWLDARITDDIDNSNNRYDVAAEINRLYPGLGPFWGRPKNWNFPDIPTKAKARTSLDVPERRRAETKQSNAKTVWQLSGAGAIGSQVLMGLPALQTLIDDPRLKDRIAVWPFDTGLAPPRASATLAEIYPSILAKTIATHCAPDDILDAVQVRVLAQAFAACDAKSDLSDMFSLPELTGFDRKIVATEEGWILGLGHHDRLASAHPQPPNCSASSDTGSSDAAAAAVPFPGYLRDPSAIYTQSFATIRAEADLVGFPDDIAEVAIRLIHACGMTDLAADIAYSPDVARTAQAALADGAPILCDTQMVAHGIIRRGLPEGVDVICTLNDPSVPDRAKALQTTRSAAAVELWRDQLQGAVVVIGNAPTALFHLLERLDQGWPRPAAILGLPVGFVGAAESKAELAANPRGVPFLTVKGRRGGSAMAAAVVNGIALGLRGDGT